MDRAKAAVSDFLSKDGKHDTTVHEVDINFLDLLFSANTSQTINPSVQHEKVIRTKHDKQQTAVDREVHQDHYHTSVQPIQDREVLPEKHIHQTAGVEHRNVKHGNDDHVRERLAAEKSQFKDHRTVAETQHTSSSDPTIVGEHVHHHVHENIQPVIQKETIQPSVVHTTVLVHEVHQNEAKHHSATELPAVSMSEFQRQGGHLGGREERTDAFAGEPRSVGGTLGGAGAKGTTSLTEEEGLTGSRRNGSHGTHGYDGNTSSSTTGTSSTSRTFGTTGAGVGAGATGATTGVGSGNNHLTGSTSHNSSNTGKKPSLMDKLNPKKDADGNGKAGFMD
ncbi:hypothetical protein G7Y89_g4047 [Cudoniella acicularis]|uniref:Allergen n=1 Tax=Cudoniella acicularis TaxID=354080 RepID=A0A8H4RRL0_9HELO|nr:hypothetical protein G7Y89_g4047 [Cudoniella acicularis]